MSSIRTPKIDLSQLDCFEQCKQVYDAYLRMLTGGQKTQVRHGDFWVEYRSNTSGDMDRLRELYSTLRAQCPAAQSALPSLDRNAVGRGPGLPLRI